MGQTAALHVWFAALHHLLIYAFLNALCKYHSIFQNGEAFCAVRSASTCSNPFGQQGAEKHQI